jgi:hypothetical protein
MDPNSDDNLQERLNNYFTMTVIGLLGVYFILESGFMKYRPLIGHASGIVVILGIVASFITWLKIHSWNNNPERKVID